MVDHKVVTRDNDIEAALRNSATLPPGPVVAEAHIGSENGTKQLVLMMESGAQHSIPLSNLERLGSAPERSVSRIEISEDGLGLHWPDLDWDLYVPALLTRIYGTKQWMNAQAAGGSK
jgi:Protein of unknown function (DUF2442)